MQFFFDHRVGRIEEDDIVRVPVSALSFERTSQTVDSPAKDAVGDFQGFDVFHQQFVGSMVLFAEDDRGGATAECFKSERAGAGINVEYFTAWQSMTDMVKQ